MTTSDQAPSLPAASGDPLVIRPGGAYAPEVRVERRDGTRVLVKDFGPCGRLFRWLVARGLVSRECRAYRTIGHIEGVPRLLGRPGPYALAIEYVEGVPCMAFRGRELPPGFWENLQRVVDALHEHGVAHADLKKPDNVLVAPDGSVWVIDFTTAIRRRSSFLHRVVFGYARDDDRRAIIKIKLELAPDEVTDEERAFLRKRPPIERLFRWCRVPFRMAAKALGGRRPPEKGATPVG